jgi:hypothetical protein
MSTETKNKVIEQAESLRERFLCQLEESQKIVKRSREALAQLDDIYRQISVRREPFFRR